ncbi:MAG TPA: glycoside hydrolase family 15 protein, partial [Acidobacteriaceae bacterium]|nr:glycoside hydrolase family 15 protein [Acidobacteriaceae bacterium]
DEWTTTTEGILHPDVPRHYMRIRPPAPGEPFHNDAIPPGYIHIANRGPGEKFDFEAREVIDGGFLELVRYGVRRADDPLIVDSLKVVDRILKINTPYGPCWRRYNHDGYGQRKDGGPYLGYGQGRAWPILTGERAHFELAAGHDVAHLIASIERFSSFGGMLPEQVWDYADMPSEHLYCGRSAGSAQPLVWAHAEYLKLLRSVVDGRVFDRISVVEERYAVPTDKRSFQSRMEIFRTTRPISQMVSGGTLRIVDADRFTVLWSTDGWASTQHTDARVIDPAGAYADIPAPPGAVGTLAFTLHWPAQNRWLGRNYEVTIHAEQPAQMPASSKPQS